MPSLYLSLLVEFLKVQLYSGKWGKKMPAFSRMLHQLQASHFSSYNLQANLATKMSLRCLEQL